MNTLLSELKRGIITENPIFVIVLGLCPSLATSTSVKNALGMGLAATFVLVCSNLMISLLRKVIPDQVRIPCYIVVIAAFVTVVELVMKAYFPALNRALGIFVPLIVVNCIILGRAEAFASKNGAGRSALDGVVMGLGFTAALLVLSTLREFLGSNKLWGLLVVPHYRPMSVFLLAPGGFFTIAAVMATVNRLRRRGAGA